MERPRPDAPPPLPGAADSGDPGTPDEPGPRRRVIPWAEVRATYEGSTVPVSTIAKAYGLRDRTIYDRAAREHWTPRRDHPAASSSAAAAYDRSVLVARLFQAVERQIAEIERRFKDLAVAGADEKDARTLAALARTLELLLGLERQARPETPETPEADIDAFRRDLARRIASLQAAEGD